MGYSIVTGEEFDVSDREVVHRPTGLRFWRYPELAEVEGSWVGGQKMRSGKEYDREEIKRMAAVVLERAEVS